MFAYLKNTFPVFLKICKEVLANTLKTSVITEQLPLYEQQTKNLYITYLQSFYNKTITRDDLANFPDNDSLAKELDWIFGFFVL